MKRELPAYLAAAEGVGPNIKVLEGGISRKNYHIGQQLPASPAVAVIIRVFSSLNSSFGDDQSSSLEDYH